MRRFCFLVFLILLATAPAKSQIFHRNPEKQLFGKSHRSTKEAKVKEPRKVLKAKKKQEANDRRLKKAYDKSVIKSQKRTIDIQTPDVQARMKQNKKDLAIREKAKKKKIRESSKAAGNKYN
jgi:LAS superfamily LD-carboxypeptidase LdcB